MLKTLKQLALKLFVVLEWLLRCCFKSVGTLFGYLLSRQLFEVAILLKLFRQAQLAGKA